MSEVRRPIDGSATLHARYQALLPNVKFQEGCIHFVHAADLPWEVVAQLIQDCAPFDLAKVREEYLKSKKR